MKPKDILVAGAGGEGAFTIEARPIETNRHYAKLEILGASVPTSLVGEGKLFGFLPAGCEKGLIVIRASIKVHSASGKFEKWHYENWFIPIERRGDMVFVEMGNVLWVAPVGVLPSVVCSENLDRYLALQIGEEVYTSNPEGAEDGGRIVENGDLLCRFLVGDIALEDLRASASEVNRRKTLEEKYQALLTQHRDLQIKQAEDADALSLQRDYLQSLVEIEAGEKAKLVEKLQANDQELRNIHAEFEIANSCLSKIRDLTKTWRSAIWSIGNIRAIVWPEEKFAG